MTSSQHSVELWLKPRHRSALLSLFLSMANAILDEMYAERSLFERIVETKELYPLDDEWPKVRKTEEYIQQSVSLVTVWAWYEFTNPRDGDFVGAGISIVSKDNAEQFFVSGEESGKVLKKVEANASNFPREKFDDWVALFKIIEAQHIVKPRYLSA